MTDETRCFCGATSIVESDGRAYCASTHRRVIYCAGARLARLPPPPPGATPPHRAGDERPEAPCETNSSDPWPLDKFQAMLASSERGAGTAPGGALPEEVEEAIRMHSVRCEERGILTDSGRENQAEEWKAIRERDAASAALRSAILSALASERSRAEAAERARDVVARERDAHSRDVVALRARAEALEKERDRAAEYALANLEHAAAVEAERNAAESRAAAEHARAERMRGALLRLWSACPDPAFVRSAALEADTDPADMIESASREYREALAAARVLASEGPPQTPESER